MSNGTIQAITLAIAVLGAVLGLLNAWRNWSGDRVRLRVGVGRSFTTSGEQGLSINIVNLSGFAVTLTYIGFDLVGTGRHLQIPLPLFMQGEKMPVRLEARTSCAVFQPLATVKDEHRWLLHRARVKTACGCEVTSKGRIVVDFKQA